MRFYFEEAAAWQKEKCRVIQKLNQSGLPLVLFGKIPAVNSSFLRDVRVPTIHICDNNPEKWGTSLWGMDVIDPDSLCKILSEYHVLILAAPYREEITDQLQQLPIPPKEIFCLDLYFDEEYSSAFFQSRQDEISNIFDRLADQESKDVYETVIRYRINRNPGFLSRIALPRAEQYFPCKLGGQPWLSPDEVFVDAGAYIGDTAERFYTAAHGRYHAIYAFEPEAENYQKLLKTTESFPHVFCKRTAVGSASGEIRFMADDSGSKADASGGQINPVDKLDHLLADVPVTYLKMDVEGMECAALRGAREIIQKNHPKLAVCTYHSNADMVDVPKLILEIDPSYRIYFRHYTNALVETVCYAL